jgi:hypothetical protein
VVKELTRGLEELKEKLRKYAPKLICFNGKGIYEETVTGRLVLYSSTFLISSVK